MYPRLYDKGNWGRWGTDDEIGMLNLVTPDVIKTAARTVKKGKVYTLGLPIKHAAIGGPSFPGRAPPIHIAMFSKGGPKGRGGGDDYITLNTHNAPTHIDALAHMWLGDTIYNNNDPNVIVNSSGASKCGIDKVGAVVTKGIMLDMAAYKRVDSLESKEVVVRKDLLKCAKWEGVKFVHGGAILLRTGYQRRFDPAHPQGYFGQNPGFGMDTVKLFEDHSMVAVGADTAYVEVHPPEDGGFEVPFHRELLWKRGTYFLEMLDLERLSADKVYEFLLVVAPLKIERGLGSPINPVAIC